MVDIREENSAKSEGVGHNCAGTGGPSSNQFCAPPSANQDPVRRPQWKGLGGFRAQRAEV